MRRKGFFSQCTILFAAILTAGCIGILPAKAGASTIVVDNTSFKEKIDEASWSNPDNIVTVEGNVLVFPKNSTADTRLITKTAARANEVEDELVQATTTISLESLPSGEKFIFALGMSSIEALPGESGNVEVQFINDGGIKASVVAYGNEGEQEVIAPFNAGKLGSNIRLEVSISKAGVLTLNLGGRKVKAQLPVSGEGRIGFLQTGSCAVRVKELRCESYRYETPENSDVFEDFAKGTINQNCLTSKMMGRLTQYLPCYARVEEYEGNQVFLCSNSAETFIGTLQEYSNFELSFDIPYIRTQTEWNEDGEAVNLVCGELIIGWGYDEANPTSSGDYLLAEQIISFRQGTQILPMGDPKLSVIPEAHKFFSTGCDRGVSIKLSMIDAQATVYLKWIDETEWTEVVSYQTGTQTPLGYVQLWMMSPGNIAIDNFKLVNKDMHKKQVALEEKYELLDRAEDYAYEKVEAVYRDFGVKEKTFNRHLLIALTATVCLATFGVVLGITEWKKRKKGGSNNDKKNMP